MTITSANPYLREHLSQDDVSCVEEGDWLRLGGPQGPRLMGRLGNAQALPTHHYVQLDAFFEPWVGRTILESYGGAGRTPEEAERQAVTAFAEGSLKPLLAAFLRPSGPSSSEREWESGGVRRKATFGAVIGRGERVPEALASEWIREVERALMSLPLAPGAHAVRIFSGRSPEADALHEAVLDNQDWPELRQVLERFAWPADMKGFDQRLFLVIQGGVDLSRALAAFIDPPEREDEVLFEEFRKWGATPLQASQQLLFLPEAFGRRMGREHGLKASDKALFLVRGDPARQPSSARFAEVNLPDEPLWRDAVRLAEQVFEDGSLTREQLEAVMGRSATLRILVDTLQRGKSAKGLIPQPLMLMIPPEVAAELEQRIPFRPVPEQAAPEPAKKPWWKLW